MRCAWQLKDEVVAFELSSDELSFKGFTKSFSEPMICFGARV
jgi:hypothetical protein